VGLDLRTHGSYARYYGNPTEEVTELSIEEYRIWNAY